MAVVGDDILWLRYQDPAPNAVAARGWAPVVSPQMLDDLRALGVAVAPLPAPAKTAGLQIRLTDPYRTLARHAKQRRQVVLRDLARKKRHYRRLLDQYRQSVASFDAQIAALAGDSPPASGQPDAAAPAQPDEGAAAADAPVNGTETGPDDLAAADDFAAAEELVRAAALRRDRDALAAAMQGLQTRFDALGRYDTDALEREMEKEEADFRAKLAAQKTGEQAAGKEQPAAPAAPTEAPAWYKLPDWWANCGGVVPGTTLKIRIEDPDIQGDKAEVLLTPVGRDAPQVLRREAVRSADEPGVFHLELPTALKASDSQSLSLNGVRSLVIAYSNPEQTEFTDRRTAYLSLASNGELRLTGSDFLADKTDYHLGEGICVMVTDLDMNKTSERDYVWVELTTDSGDREVLPIRESQPHSGVFRGSIPTRFGEPTENDGTLSGKFAGAFEAHYGDELWRGEGVLPPVRRAQGRFATGTDGAAEIFARQLTRGALHRDVLFNTARAAYELGKSAIEMGAAPRGRRHLLDSRDKFETLIVNYADDDVCAHATYYLGNILFLLDDYEGAVRSLRQVVDRWPKTAFKSKALYKLGACHMKAGRMDKAIEVFVNLAYHHPDSPLVADAMLALGHHFSMGEQYRHAVDVGRAFIEKFPEHEKTPMVYQRVGGWLIIEKRLQEAIEIFEQAEKKLPEAGNMAAILYWHADCLFKTASSRSLHYKRGIVLLQRIVYDYADSKWAEYASARLTEFEEK